MPGTKAPPLCRPHFFIFLLVDAGKMAKVGEGDERWIVKEREDGKNCNGWHWSETNLTEWSKEQLTTSKLEAARDIASTVSNIFMPIGVVRIRRSLSRRASSAGQSPLVSGPFG